MTTRVLFIEDDEEIRENVAELLLAEGFEPVTAKTGEEGLAMALREPPDLILCDIALPGMDGYAVIRAVSEYPQTEAIPFVFVSARADRADVRHGMSLGADDYVTKPFSRADLLDAVRSRLHRTRALTSRSKGSVPPPPPGASVPTFAAPGVVVAAPAMEALHAELQRIAQGDISVLILGETGVGKEVLARAVHDASRRRGRPFVAIHCAALPENLLESELFGHEKGAFTGATQAQKGLLESAEGGTVFLDELGEIPLSVQVKLLRAIETKRVLRVGSRAEKAIDVRFVSATSADLEADIGKSAFRADLYYRLAGHTLSVPPLRARVPEIVPIARTFLAEVSSQLGRPVPRLEAGAISALESYAWPGNVRELRNVIERAALLSGGEVLERAHLPARVIEQDRTSVPSPVPGARDSSPRDLRIADGALRTEIEAVEREKIIEALARCAGNQTQAAQRLGISRRTLVARLSEYDIPRPRKRG
jgi:DNA-binding NtrC family response regulator